MSELQNGSSDASQQPQQQQQAAAAPRSPLKPPAAPPFEGSAYVAPRDSDADVSAATAVLQQPDTRVQDSQPIVGPGHEGDAREEGGKWPVEDLQGSAGEGGGASQAVSETARPPAALNEAAPGTANPYDGEEEADVGVKQEPSGGSTAAAQPRPSEQAVAPARESVLSPVEVAGDASAAYSARAQSESNETHTEPQSSIAEPASAIGVGAETDPTSTEAQPTPSAPATSAHSKDVVMSDATDVGQAAVSSDVAPAVAGLGGEASLNGSVDADASGQPPLKRQRTATLSSSQGPEGAAVPASTRPAFADSSSIEMTPAQLKFAQNSLKSMKVRPESQAFLAPVDPVALNIPQYTNIVKKPMDLGTIDMKLALTAAAAKGGKPTEKTKQAAAWKLDPSRDVYHSVEEWEADVRLVFANCLQFNGPDHIISQSAKTLEAVFEKQLKSLPVELPPAPQQSSASTELEKRARRPSNPVPTIRRSSSDASGRPKREIHPPAPRDLPYADEPQSASSGKKRKSSKALTPRQQAYYAKVSQDELKYCQKVVDEFFIKQTLTQVAWPFYDLVDKSLDFAAAYYAMIKKPICLKQIQEKFRQGLYRDKGEFLADMNLLFTNCYTFNDPGSDVHSMGKQVETAFQDRMKKMPQPRPLSPEPDEDEDEDDDDEAELAAKIADLEEQLAQLRRQQQTAKSNKTAAAAKKKAAKAAAAEAAAKKKAAKATKSAGSNGDGVSKKSKKKKTLTEEGSDDEDSFRPVTWEQKEELASKIALLPDDRLEGALKIISEERPQNADLDEEIELDIDDLSPRILYKLYRFVVKPKRKPGPKPGTAKGASSKQSTGKKRKNLDEEQEAMRIAALQEQLQSFDRGPEAASTPAAGGAAPAASHDDLVQSDSSSGEEDSDGSDSDY